MVDTLLDMAADSPVPFLSGTHNIVVIEMPTAASDIY